MANAQLFSGTRGRLMPAADTVNLAGGAAYAMPGRDALAQLAATGCLSGTYYATAQGQLDSVIALLQSPDVTPDFVARLAVYARQRAAMKDMPALLLAWLAINSPADFDRAAPHVLDKGRMVRNLVQILRSGALGRKSIPHCARRMLRRWLLTESVFSLVHASIGQDPSLADVIKMVRPKTPDPERNALLRWIMAKEVDAALLPPDVRAFDAMKRGEVVEIPNMPHEMLVSLPLTVAQWKVIASRMGWQALRMNLATLKRHGALDDAEIVADVARRLGDRDAVAKAKAFPHQLFMAFLHADAPMPIMLALQDALDASLDNVPSIEGKVAVCVDISGSMQSPITGDRPGATSKARCVDVAALIASATLRKNPSASVIVFNTAAGVANLNPRDSVATNARALASLLGGGTAVSVGIACAAQFDPDVVIVVSDNESWRDPPVPAVGLMPRATQSAVQWAALRSRRPRARVVCIDLTPNVTTQVANAPNEILNVGGWNDACFQLLADFASGKMGAGAWAAEIEKVEI